MEHITEQWILVTLSALQNRPVIKKQSKGKFVAVVYTVTVHVISVIQVNHTTTVTHVLLIKEQPSLQNQLNNYIVQQIIVCSTHAPI